MKVSLVLLVLLLIALVVIGCSDGGWCSEDRDGNRVYDCDDKPAPTMDLTEFNERMSKITPTPTVEE